MPLPNPNIEFVPLDKLTAAQLNQLIANIISLANGTGLNNKSVNGDKLADKSVKPEHIVNSILTISGSSEYTASNNSTVKFNKVSSKVGDLLSFSDNSIVIGPGVSKILVSANIFVKTTTPAGYAWGTLKKNNTSVGCHTIANAAGNFATLSFSPYSLDVSPGDRIHLEFFDAPGGGIVSIRGQYSWLTGQVIA